jgi:hypothetical protein
MDVYPWIVLLHIVGAFVFAISHGVSGFAAFAIRASRQDEARVRTLLEVSGYSLGSMYIGLLLLLVGGIWAGIYAGHFARGWIWAALIVLVVVIVAMYAMASRFYAEVRTAVGLPSSQDKKGVPPAEPLGSQELAAKLDTRRPEALAGIGIVALLLILWLMVVKPF